MTNKGLAQYQKVSTQSAIDDASPHRLIQMLMEGALQRLAEAKSGIQKQCLRTKGEAIGKAISIVGGLRDALNPEVSSDIADNLDGLYDYMQRRLLQANVQNNEEYIEEVMQLMLTIKSGWDGIADQVA